MVSLESVPRSTQWARDNKDKVARTNYDKSRTLNGKLITLITTSRYRCKSSGLDHNIDSSFLKKIYEEQNGMCAISGKVMEIRGSKNAANSPYSISLDRIDSTQGYVVGNVWLVCTGINLMKSRLTMDQFVEFCRLTTERFG